ncbi:MAG: DNA-3-methyladenine glycosylase [Promethearchaeota archaeon]|nr:MAG: DNA-3-methyladenine glycosylase [Candidatus Lokiarchaeota archaeon]
MSSYTRLKRAFFDRETKMVAKELLGKYLVRKTPEGDMVGKIVETEAYLGPNDKACHCYNNKKTEKTRIMYEKPGTFYVYYIYGMYFCLNVITESEGMPCAVFIRELYPIDGIDLMKKYRKVKIGKNYKNLVDGPSKLCMALNITKESFNGKDSCSPLSKLFFTKGEERDREKITLHARIGIDYAEEDKDKLLRFKLNDDKKT